MKYNAKMIHIDFTLSYLEIYLIFINLTSFILYGYDKALALKTHKNISRISENKLLFTTLLGGTITSLIAMLLFRHKIKKVSFIIKFLLVFIIQIVLVILYLQKEVILEKLHTLI